jgi:hypothetical protein
MVVVVVQPSMSCFFFLSVFGLVYQESNRTSIILWYILVQYIVRSADGTTEYYAYESLSHTHMGARRNLSCLCLHWDRLHIIDTRSVLIFFSSLHLPETELFALVQHVLLWLIRTCF